MSEDWKRKIRAAAGMVALIAVSVYLQRRFSEPDFFPTLARRGKALIPAEPAPPEPPHAWIRELYDGTR